MVDRLIDEGYYVKVIDDLTMGTLLNLKKHLDSSKLEFVKGDIRDPVAIERCVKGIDVIAHLAALTSVPFSVEYPDLVYDVNVSGSLNLMYSAIKAGVGRFVFASSCAVFGDTTVLPVTESAVFNPISPYAESKLAIERCCRGFYKRGLLGSVVLRFFNVYGPRQGLSEYSGVITKFFDAARRGLPLVIFGDGLQTRDFVSVYDVVDSVYLAMTLGSVEGKAFNIGSGKETNIHQIAQTILELTGSDVDICYEQPRLGDIQESCADISKAKRLLKFQPKVALKDGLVALV
ncbi:MAG: NAD-dependent epimerase/dehydratase family protein [Lentisphaerae bacterium]|nr:NAD-dependent epimerase/dehydratase family protein [Lentisphaerota bacterium]